MPIDFNQQAFFDPKIDIIGKEVPVAEIEKTGNVLQNRFDTSYEQYSAADEALKQMEARANPVDREKAKELRGMYKGEMDKILEQGDFHNMRRQTQNLARNAAINYKAIEEKNAAIQKGLDEIAKSPKYQLDPEGAKQEYLKSLKSISFDPETRAISDFNVGAYSAPGDVNIAEKALKIAPTIRTKTTGGESAKLAQEMVNGQPVWMKITAGGKKEYLSADEINRELSAYLKTDPEVQAYIARDTGRLGYDVNTKEGKEVYDKLLNERISGSTKALGDMYSVDTDIRTNDFQVLGDGLNSKGKGDYTNVVPVNTVADAVGINPNEPLRETLSKGLTTEKYNLNKITEFANEYIDMAKKTKNKALEQKYSDFKGLVNQAGNLSKEDRAALAPIFTYSIFGKNAGLGSMSTNIDSAIDALPAKLKPLGQKLYSFANKKLFDTDTEEAFKQFNSQNKGFQNVNLNAISIQDQETNNKVQGFLNKSLASNDFEAFKGELKKDANYTLAKVTDRPLGNGTGILFELKDQGTGETVLVTPKDPRMLKAVYGIFPGMETDIFKNTSDFSKGEVRPIKEIFKENNFQLPDLNILEKKLKTEKNEDAKQKIRAEIYNIKKDPNIESSIKFNNNGVYQKLDKNGNVIEEANHFVDLID